MSLIKRFFNLPNDRSVKTIGMAGIIGFCCAVLVSVTAVVLEPKRLANIALEQEKKMQVMLSELPGLEGVLRESGADSLQTVLVDLRFGTEVDPVTADAFKDKQNENNGSELLVLDKNDDIAGIVERPNFVQVHMLRKQGELELLLLPVYGKGYQSTIKAWLSLAGDLNTVVALSVFEQGETPGIGTRITEESWLKLWAEKKVYDSEGNVALTVVKGQSSTDNEVDGISGATRSSNGISGMIQFWLGDLGFGKYINNLRLGDNSVSAR